MNLLVRCRKGRKAQTLYVVVYCAVLFYTSTVRIMWLAEDIRLVLSQVLSVSYHFIYLFYG